MEAIPVLLDLLRQTAQYAANRGAQAEAQTWHAWAAQLGTWMESVDARIAHLEAEAATLRQTLDETLQWANQLHDSLEQPPTIPEPHGGERPA